MYETYRCLIDLEKILFHLDFTIWHFCFGFLHPRRIQRVFLFQRWLKLLGFSVINRKHDTQEPSGADEWPADRLLLQETGKMMIHFGGFGSYLTCLNKAVSLAVADSCVKPKQVLRGGRNQLFERQSNLLKVALLLWTIWRWVWCT